MLPQLAELIPLVTTVAREELLPRFHHVERQFKKDGSIVTEADLAVQQRLEEKLSREWPDIPILGEEMSEAQQQETLVSSTGGLWVIDPLDGTSNFAADIPYFAVSLALLVNSEPKFGLVYDPIRDECFSAVAGEGAFLNGKRIMLSKTGIPLNKCVALIDFKRLEPGMARALVGNPPYSSQRSFGAVALDLCYMAAGRGHLYLHGKMKLWDLAAGWLILEEAGGYSATLGGERLFIADLQPRSAVAAIDSKLFREWCKVLETL
jgi:myo-inositol-1(or 4)-monophosphatase